MQTSESIKELAGALAKAQGVMGGALKDSANPFFKSKYADLESVWQACRRALSENGLAVVQSITTSDEGTPAITTMLAHASGEWVRDTFMLTPKDQGPQSIGSVISYGRRYALAAMVGVYQTDDDAEAAQGRTTNGPARRPVDEEAEYRAAAQRMREALDLDLDESIYELHTELNKRQEFYIAASGCLTPAERKGWKDRLARAKQDRTAMLPNGRGV